MDIRLKDGQIAVIDDADYPLVKNYRWRLHSAGYAVASIGPGGRTFVYMHLLIKSSPFGHQVDHRDRNRLNNRRDNLRVATLSQQRRNQSKRSAKTSSCYKGVCWDRSRSKWMASIGTRTSGKLKNYHLGRFSYEIEAALAYNKAATEKFGEFAALNAL